VAGCCRLANEGMDTMRLTNRSIVFASVAAAGILGLGATPARAQAFGFGFSSPGFALGVGNAGFGYYGGPYYGGGWGYPYIAPAPYVVPPSVVVNRPYVVRGPYGWGRPFYGGYRYGYRPYRPYRYGYRYW